MGEQRILVTADEAARLLRIGRSTFWENVRKNILPQPVKIGGATRWRLAELVSLLGASPTTMPSTGGAAEGTQPGYTQP
jgi:predicted DNA-binding transcriptional regulator AlpA